jgi:hypothetical protein
VPALRGVHGTTEDVYREDPEVQAAGDGEGGVDDDNSYEGRKFSVKAPSFLIVF